MEVEKSFHDIVVAHKYEPSELFMTIYQEVKDKSMIGINTLRSLYEFVIMANVLDGDIAEAGVHKGGTTYLLASASNDKTVHAFDSWEGLPEPTDEDFEGLDKQAMGKGWGKCDPPIELLSKFGNRVKLYKGWFSNTLNLVFDKQFCFVHIDCDRYQSVKECLEFFYPRMVHNGIIVVDDYNFKLTPGATKASDDFFSDKLQSVERFVYGGLYIKVLNEQDGGRQCLSGK